MVKSMEFKNKFFVIIFVIVFVSFCGYLFCDSITEQVLKYVPKGYAVEKVLKARTIDNQLDYIVLNKATIHDSFSWEKRKMDVVNFKYSGFVLHPKSDRYVKYPLFSDKVGSFRRVNIEARDVNSDGVNEIVVYGYGNGGFDDVNIFRWIKDKYRKIWTKDFFEGKVEFKKDEIILISSKFGNVFAESITGPHIRVAKEYKWDSSKCNYKKVKEFQLETPYQILNNLMLCIKNKIYQKADKYLQNVQFISTSKSSFYNYFSSKKKKQMEDMLVKEVEKTDSTSSFKFSLRHYPPVFLIDFTKISGKWRIVKIKLLKDGEIWE